ncbi:hypothetical protein AVEN_118688-1 [Araneus ventricosus]|uniref:Uncharacterized protein n=1 Tax=Araneus ventricosus TaxID=182803 RepID=A0A4Y2AX60_ARAVE|nr:hypothetical protein AVEN_118688-1 [Araneus ventricosus]
MKTNYGAVWILSDSRSSIQHLKDWNNVGDRTGISKQYVNRNENRLDKYDSCFEKIGLKSESFLEAVDEACLPETPVDVGKKFQACKIEIQMEWKKQNVSLSQAPKSQGNGNMSLVDIYIKYCLPVREKLLDEGWLQYFLAGVLPL